MLAASPSDAAIAAADDAGLIDLAVRCVSIDGMTYCLHRGWDEQGVGSSALEAAKQQARTGTATTATGDMSLVAHLRQWAAQPRAERVRSERAELEEAKKAAGKMVYYNSVINGIPVPADFAKRYPQYAYLADSGVTTSAIVSCSYPDGYEMCTVMNPAYMKKQETYYYCGPASMQTIAWNNPGSSVYKTQASWASILGTTPSNGTYIGTLASKINSYTNWDDYTGAYVVVSIANWTETNYINLFKTHIKTNTAPIQLHPLLKPGNNGYYPGSTGGHFNVGRGYAAEPTFSISIFEPAGGPAQGNIYPSVTAWDSVKNVRQANLDNSTQRNIAY